MIEFLHSSDLELEIRSLLNVFRLPHLAADTLYQKYKGQSLNLEQIETISNFFLKAGEYSFLISFLLDFFEKKQLIPWAHLAEVLSFSKVKPSNLLYKALKKSSMSQGALDHLVKTRNPDFWLKDPDNFKSERRKHYLELRNEFKKQLFSQLEILKIQNLSQEEHKLLNKILRYFPTDPSALEYEKNMKLKIAEDYLEKFLQNKKLSDISFSIEHQQTAEEITFFDSVLNSMIKWLKENPLNSKEKDQMIYDFAIAHAFWENFNACLQLLDKGPLSIGPLWLKIESLIWTRHFVQALEALSQVEMNFSGDPEIVFASQYLKAQALWGLEKKADALLIIEEISNLRPHYRSAAALFNEWSGKK